MFCFFFLLISLVIRRLLRWQYQIVLFVNDTAFFISFFYFISLSSVSGLATPGRGVKGGDRQRERGGEGREGERGKGEKRRERKRERM